MAAALLRIPLNEVTLEPVDPALTGLTDTAAVVSWEGLRRQLCAVLAGPLVVGRPVRWPPELDPIDPGDEHASAVLVGVLGLDTFGWLGVDTLTRELMELPGTRRAVRAVAEELLEFGRVTGERVREICAAAFRPPVNARDAAAPHAPPEGPRNPRTVPRDRVVDAVRPAVVGAGRRSVLGSGRTHRH